MKNKKTITLALMLSIAVSLLNGNISANAAPVEGTRVESVSTRQESGSESANYLAGYKLAYGCEYNAVYRLYFPGTGEHFYTLDENERNTIMGWGWQFEGVGWYAPVKGDPVYRLSNPNNGDHHYTVRIEEKEWLVGLGWIYEGIGWYSVPTPVPGAIWYEYEEGVDMGATTIVWKNYNPNCTGAGSHNYTADYNEYQFLSSAGWNDEKNAWFGVDVNKWVVGDSISDDVPPAIVPADPDDESDDNNESSHNDSDTTEMELPEYFELEYGDPIVVAVEEPLYMTPGHADHRTLYPGTGSTINIHCSNDPEKEADPYATFTVYVNGNLDAPIEIIRSMEPYNYNLYDYCWKTYPEACSKTKWIWSNI